MTRKKESGKASKCFEENRSFSEEDRQELHEINDTIKLIVHEIKNLKEELQISNYKVKHLEAENEKLKKSVNLTLFKLDALEQYGRRENLRIYGLPESNSTNDDGEEAVLKIAKVLNIDLNSNDIQRAHRMGRPSSKPRPVIARFLSYKKRNQMLFAKSKLKINPEFTNAFITEDLTPLRHKLLKYVKYECDDKFVLCHTINGNIKMKKSAKKAGLITGNEKDQGTGAWITVTSPDDLFRNDVDIDFDKLNYKPLLCNSESVSEACSSSY